jgi:hypothetical protein
MAFSCRTFREEPLAGPACCEAEPSLVPETPPHLPFDAPHRGGVLVCRTRRKLSPQQGLDKKFYPWAGHFFSHPRWNE